mgnify:CR=1 FL=1
MEKLFIKKVKRNKRPTNEVLIGESLTKNIRNRKQEGIKISIKKEIRIKKSQLV